MARAQHEPHSGGSLCLGTSGETGQPQAIVLTFPLPREKSKNTRPPPGLTTHQTRSMHAPHNFLIRSYANTHTPA